MNSQLTILMDILPTRLMTNRLNENHKEPITIITDEEQ